jgi:hypothetical protein
MTDLHDESKTDLSLRRKCCEKFHVFQGWIRHFYYIRQLWYTFLPRNSYRMPQNYNRHACEPSCSCTHRFFLDISSIFVLVQSENTCYSTPLKTIQPSISNWLHSTLLIFNPHTTPLRMINKTLLLQNSITQQRNAQFTNVLTYISQLLEALQGWTGNIYNCTHQLSPSGDIPHRNSER